jgi:peptidyl-prolyl cis-trans isomerase A (cyclophilin A)
MTMTIRFYGIAAIALASIAVPVPAHTQAAPATPSAKLRNPAALTEQAPANYKAKFDTSAGVFVVQVHRDWAPLGADRFYNMVKNGFFDDVRFFRVLPDFMVQFGFNGDPAVTAAWDRAKLKDDPVKQSNKRGYMTFANTGGPDTRGTNVFISYKDNAFLDSQFFAPFGEVVQGMNVVEKINPQYKEQPNQNSIRAQGNAYLAKTFPKMDYIKKATIEP